MRTNSLVFLLALAGTALSGCASGFDTAFTQSSIPGGNNGTDTGGDGISGDTNGTGEGNEVTLASGDTAIAYTSGSRSIDGSGRAQLVVTATGSAAQVSVDPGVPMGFTGTTTMARYLTQTGAATAPAGFPAYQFQDTDYVEYRRITATTDSELQVWNFTDGNGDNNYAAHFRDVARGQGAWFFGGQGGTDSTETEALAAANTSINYTGTYAGIAAASGWGEASTYSSGDGQWRFNGDANVTAHFGTATFNGTLTPNYWEKFEDQSLIQIDVGAPVATVSQEGITIDAAFGDIKAFHTATIELSGTITGNRIAGTSNIVTNNATVNHSAAGTTIDNNRFVNGDRALQAGLYGTNAEQVTGVFGTFGVLPTPTGGDTGINDDGRGTIDIQGVFHGQ